MHITMPARRRAATEPGRRPRRAARLSATVAALAVPALIGGTALASPASASSVLTTHITPTNTFFLMLDVSGASTQAGAPVIDWYANGGANQSWSFVPSGGTHTYEIVNGNSGQCLTSDGVPGDQVYQFPCVSSPTQQWRTNLATSPNYCMIQNVASGLYLDVSANSVWPGTAIDTWYYNGNSNQYFGTI